MLPEQTPLTTLKGVGPSVAARLAGLQLHTVQDLLLHLPLRYQDRTRLCPIGSCRIGSEAQVEGEVLATQIAFGRRRSMVCTIKDHSGVISLRFFHFSAAQKNALRPGTRIRCYGEVRGGKTGLELYHPEYQFLNAADSGELPSCLAPVYPSTEGLQQTRLRGLIGQALTMLNVSLSLRDWIPATIRESLGFSSLAEAIIFLHQPPAGEALYSSLQALALGQHPSQRRLAFEAQHPEMAQGGVVAQQKLEAARTQLRNLEADLAAAQSALAAIGGQLAGTPQTLPGGAGGGAGASLARAQADLAAMQARGLTDSHPDVISVKNQITMLKTAARQESESNLGVPNPAYTSLQSIRAEREANLQALQSRLAAARSDVAALTAQQISNPELGAEAKRINRDYDVLRQQYDKLLQDREELRLRGEIKTEREAVKFEVVDPPTTPRKPVAPNRPLLLFGVLLVGIVAGCGSAFGLSKLRSTFATSTGLERATGLPVLGAISTTLTEAGRAMRERKLKYFYGASAALGGLFIVLLAVEFIQRGSVA